jgi:hypothetical protein
MKIRTVSMLGWLAPLILGSCATKPPQAPDTAGKITAQMRSGSAELRAIQVMDWTAPDDRTLLVNGVDRSVYQARFNGQCTGLRLVDTIAFIVPGPPQVDRYVGIVLPDGKRCTFKSLERLAIPAGRGKEN